MRKAISKTSMNRAFFLVAGIYLGATLAAEAFAADRVKTANGVVEATTQQAAGVRVFKGIPFAQPPVGALRWREPQPVKNWKGVRHADKFGPRCMQRTGPDADYWFRSNGCNKSIYRTRMAIADGGELIVLAPGLKEFGEDKQIDALIRKYGYVGTPKVLEYARDADDLKNNLSAAAHLIHGSSEGRFSITYCPGHLTKQKIESVNFIYADCPQMMKKYVPEKLKDGFNKMPNGEEIFYISNPALGLWAHKERFK